MQRTFVATMEPLRDPPLSIKCACDPPHLFFKQYKLLMALNCVAYNRCALRIYYIEMLYSQKGKLRYRTVFQYFYLLKFVALRTDISRVHSKQFSRDSCKNKDI